MPDTYEWDGERECFIVRNEKGDQVMCVDRIPGRETEHLLIAPNGMLAIETTTRDGRKFLHYLNGEL